MNFYSVEDLKDNEIYLDLVATFEADLERGWVPYYQFDIYLLNGEKIGFCNLRIDNSQLTKYCGNIGYEIIEKYRGKHYSKKASELLLKLAKKHEMKYVLINCEPQNFASNRICELLGAKYVEMVDIPKTHEMYQQGKKQMNIYRINF